MPCLFLGYSSSQNAYKCIDLDTSRIYLSRHVFFDKSIFPFSSSAQVTKSSLSVSGANTQDLAIPAVPFIGLTPSSHTTVTESTPTAPVLFPQPASSPAQSRPAKIPQPATLVAPTQPIRTHIMTTRSMNNIHKPKHLYLATKHLRPQHVEPTCVS